MNIEGDYFFNSGILYRMAKLAYQRTKSSATETARGQDDALIALIFSAAALEAFIMELAHFADAGADVWPTPSSVRSVAGILDEAESSRGSVRLKFLMAKAVLSGQSYDKGTKPYEDFALLITIRDAILHHKPEKITQDPHKIVAALSARGLCQRDVQNSKSPWLHQIATRAVARWACNVVRDMIASIRACFPENAEKTPNPFVFMAFHAQGFEGVD